MDMLFKRYACPFSLIDEMIQSCQFDEWVSFITKKSMTDYEDERLWDLYIHKDFEEESFNDFKSKINIHKSDEIDEAEKQTIINKSQDILNNFKPKEGGAS